MFDWKVPENWQKVTAIDVHVGGEPLRIVTSGAPRLYGDTIQDLYKDAVEKHDWFRKRVIFEPRGHADMYGALLVSPETTAADFGVLFMDSQSFTPMCGHGIIGLATVLVEAGVVTMLGLASVLKFDTPAGEVTAHASVDDNDRVQSVGMVGVASYVQHLDYTVQVPEVGQVVCDIAYGGEWYAFVDADVMDLDVIPSNAARFSYIGRLIKAALREQLPDIPLYGLIFVQDSPQEGIHSRNVNVFGNGALDRSPTGTGLSARLAIHHARGDVETQQNITVGSITGATFIGRVMKTANINGKQGIVPIIQGNAKVVGKHEFYYDPNDPLAEGFLLR